MTFDALEIGFALQRYFKLDRKKRAPVETVGELANFIIAQTPTTASASCPTADAFHTLREKLHNEFNLPFDVLHPATPTVILIADNDPRVIWKRLAQTLAVRLPALDYPGWSVFIAAPLTIAAIAVPFIAAAIFKDDIFMQLVACGGGLFGSIAILLLLERLLRPICAKQIPAHLQTLGGLAYLLAVESKKAKGGPWSPAEIMATVQLVLGASARKNPREMRRRLRLEFE
ncbi:MAG: hypothetical protein ACTHN5_16055 [Phycisphaerae bacterium]